MLAGGRRTSREHIKGRRVASESHPGRSTCSPVHDSGLDACGPRPSTGTAAACALRSARSAACAGGGDGGGGGGIGARTVVQVPPARAPEQSRSESFAVCRLGCDPDGTRIGLGCDLDGTYYGTRMGLIEGP